MVGAYSEAVQMGWNATHGHVRVQDMRSATLFGCTAGAAPGRQTQQHRRKNDSSGELWLCNALGGVLTSAETVR